MSDLQGAVVVVVVVVVVINVELVKIEELDDNMVAVDDIIVVLLTVVAVLEVEAVPLVVESVRLEDVFAFNNKINTKR